MTANRTLTTLPTWINDDTTAPTPPPTYGPQFHRQSDLQATAGDELGNLESVDVNLVNTITPWREDPKLTAHFHPDFPDDIQVVVHDGGLRTTDKHPELVWVRVMNGCAPWYSGTVLNQPTQLLTVHQGSTIYFVAPQGGKHPLMVTEQYIRERPDWTIEPCQRCGLTELFDEPSKLLKITFPDLHIPEGRPLVITFSTFCCLCGGILMVSSRTSFIKSKDT